LALTLDGKALSFSMKPMGDGLCATQTLPGGNVTFRLWLRPEPDANKPAKLTCVLVTNRISGEDSGTLIGGATVPEYLELVPEGN
jgi:hypothetical protein